VRGTARMREGMNHEESYGPRVLPVLSVTVSQQTYQAAIKNNVALFTLQSGSMTDRRCESRHRDSATTTAS